jgi:hypothetical protein
MSQTDPVNHHAAVPTTPGDDATEPLFSVVKGSPTPALVAVLLTAPAARPTPTRAPSGWSAYRRSVRSPLPVGPEAWRLSGR